MKLNTNAKGNPADPHDDALKNGCLCMSLDEERQMYGCAIDHIKRLVATFTDWPFDVTVHAKIIDAPDKSKIGTNLAVAMMLEISAKEGQSSDEYTEEDMEALQVTVNDSLEDFVQGYAMGRHYALCSEKEVEFDAGAKKPDAGFKLNINRTVSC